MNAFKFRPFAVFSISFYIAACFFAELEKAHLLILTGTLGAFAVLFTIINMRTRVSILPTLVLFALLAASVFSLLCFQLTAEKYSEITGEKTVRGKIIKSEFSTDVYGLYLADINIDGKELRACLTSSKFLRRGDSFEGKVQIDMLPEDLSYLKSENVFLLAEDSGIKVKYAKDEDASNIFYSLNMRLCAELSRKLGRDAGGFASSVLLGNRKDLSPKLYSELKNMGVSHLIALSGLHLSVICAIASFLCRPLGKKATLLTSASVAAFYMIFTDFSPSIVRAGVMLIVFSLIFFLGRGRDIATALGFAAFFVTIISPAAVFDLGFQLSLAAVAGVNCANGYVSEKWYEERTTAKKIVMTIISPLAVGLGATLFTIPILLLRSSSFTWVGAVITIPMSMLLSLIIWTLPLLFIIPFKFYSDTVGFLISLFEKTANIFSDAGEFSLLCQNKYPGAALAALAAFGFVFALCIKRRARRIIAIIISSALVIAFSAICAGNFYDAKITSTSVITECGDGDILTFKNGESTLVLDVTSGSKSACRQMCQTALSLSDTEIDAVIIADPHSSHYSALTESYLLYCADIIYLPDEPASAYLAKQLQRETDVILYNAGDTFDFNGITVEILPTLTTSRSTRPSLAFAVASNSEKTVYLGSSYIELGGTVPLCDKLYLGSYGPAYKKEFTVPRGNEVITSSKAKKYVFIP